MLPIAAITTTGKVVLLIVAGAFMLYALVCAMWIPRRNPTFPGKRLPLFIAVSALFFIAQIATVVWVTGTQEVESEASAAETEPSETVTTPVETGTVPGETESTPVETKSTPTETESTETESTETETAPATPTGNAAAGKAVFASAGCTSCHTLADAGSKGSVGPNLDDAKPSEELVVDRVTNGQGVMPSFKGQLTDQQIQDVAAYVSSVAGS